MASTPPRLKYLTADLESRPARYAARVVARERLRRVRLALPSPDEPPGEDALHDFRVALRRLRTWLRAFGSELDDTVGRGTLRRLRRLSRRTGRARDLEVQLRWLTQPTAPLGPLASRAAAVACRTAAAGAGRGARAGAPGDFGCAPDRRPQARPAASALRSAGADGCRPARPRDGGPPRPSPPHRRHAGAPGAQPGDLRGAGGGGTPGPAGGQALAVPSRVPWRPAPRWPRRGGAPGRPAGRARRAARSARAPRPGVAGDPVAWRCGGPAARGAIGAGSTASDPTGVHRPPLGAGPRDPRRVPPGHATGPRGRDRRGARHRGPAGGPARRRGTSRPRRRQCRRTPHHSRTRPFWSRPRHRTPKRRRCRV